MQTAYCQPPAIEWDRSFGGLKQEEMYAMIQTADGGYLLGGDSDSPVSGAKTQGSQGINDYWVVRTNGSGIKLWDKRFGGSSREELFAVKQTPDGGFILGGWSMSAISGDQTQISRGSSDYWIVKVDADGNKLWDKRYGGPGDDELRAMEITSDGGYIFVGESSSGIGGEKTESNHGEFDVWAVKTDVNGNLEWEASYGGSLDDRVNAIQQTADGGFVIGAWTISPVGFDVTQPGRGSSDMWLIRTDASGQKLWDGRYGGDNNEYLYSLDQTQDGGFILGGYTRSNVNGEVTIPGKGGFDFWIVKTDLNGIKLWDKRYGAQLDEKGKSIAVTADGGFIMGGWSESLSGGDKTESTKGASDYWLIKTDAAGNLQWDKDLGAANEERLHDVLQTSDGGFIVAGHSFSGNNGDKTQSNTGINDYWIVKLAATTPTQLFYADNDNDGFGNVLIDTLAVSAPAGYVEINTDCNDNNAAINPAASEICNAGIDDNCNGLTDDGDITVTGQLSFYSDNDLDTYGTGLAILACVQPNGSSLTADDCNDNNAAINPAASEICNAGIDDNCNGLTDDGDITVTGQLSFYSDNDLDTYGTGLAILACVQPNGTSFTADDCNDNNAAINPAASEICNAGIDDNCNGLTDDGDITLIGLNSYYADLDQDSYGSGAAMIACIQPAGSSLSSGDCNDNNAAINPAANEICNAGIDDNCNGLADDSDLTTTGQSSYYTDSDNDNFGSNIPVYACSQPVNTLLVSGDCNDNESTIHPLAKELCNGGIDDNCNGMADDADTTVIGRPSYYTDNDHDNYGSGAAIKACIQPEGTSSENDDCNNNNAAVYPGAPEICNGGIDDNCNGLTDDGDPTLIGLNSYYVDGDHDSYGTGDALLACIQPAATATMDGDCNDNDAAINPAAAETCNAGIDDNCNGLADDADGTITGQGTYYLDNDEDSYGGETIIAACLQPSGSTLTAGDCNDVNAAVNPGATDLCNGTDDNCNLVTDENQLAVPVINPEGEISACSGDAVLLSAAFDPSMSYQWYKGNSLINGATSNTYSTTKAGSFKVKISTMPGCEATSAFTMISRFDKPNAQINALGNLDICTTGAVDLLANEGTGLQYQWKKGNSLLDGATNMLYTATSKGTYRVIVTSADGCSKTSGGIKVTSSCKTELLLAKEVSSELLVYPNPADRFIMVELSVFDESSGSAVIELTDLLGRVVQSVKVPFSGNLLQYQLPLDAAIADGNYVLRVTTGNEVFVKQVVVQQ
ncbi:MAG: T9SS type A sorting domain-containing protein [Chitinophagales bacterium]|nr:T9SS type A sorting domain-containing protein [Chitinophagales bacterium]